MKRFLILVLVLGMWGCGEEESSREEVYRIGWFGPLTGDMASYGEMAHETVKLRFEQVNAAGGIGGNPVEIIWEDAKCNPKEGAQVVQKLVHVDQVRVIFGSCSGTMLSALPITEKAEVLLLTAFATTPQLTGAGNFTFRTVPSDSSQGKVLADYASAHFEKVGLVVEQTDYAMGVGDTFAEHFKGEIVREDFLTAESDFKTRITKLKNADLEALVMVPQSPPKFDLWAKQLQEQGWEAAFIGSEIIASDQEIVTGHKDFLASHQSVATNFIVPDSEALGVFLEQYQEQYGRSARFENYVAAHVDLIDVFVSIAEGLDDPQDTKALRDGFLDLPPTEGLIGMIRFNEEGDVDFGHQLLRFDGERFVERE